MAIRIPGGFTITSPEGIDKRMTLTKAEMLAIPAGQLPAQYFAICEQASDTDTDPDVGKLFVYNKHNTASTTTGKFELYAPGSDSSELYIVTASDVTSTGFNVDKTPTEVREAVDEGKILVLKVIDATVIPNQEYLVPLDSIQLSDNTCKGSIIADTYIKIYKITNSGTGYVGTITQKNYNEVSVASTGTATDEVQYITIDGEEKKLSTSDMVGASSTADGAHGLVPQPHIADANKYLRGDGSWQTLPQAMIFKGTLGEGGTVTALPTPSASTVGFTYKVIKEGEYITGETAKVGDMYICAEVSTGAYSWVLVPSGDEPKGTVTNITVGTGLKTADGQPITETGTISINTDGATEGQLMTAKADGTVEWKTLDLSEKLDVPGNEPISGTPYNLPYYFYTDVQADKTIVHAKTITLDNNKTEGDYPLEVSAATTAASGLMSAADKVKLDGISEEANKVEVSDTGTETSPVVKYIKIDGTESKLPMTEVVDNLESIATDKALSANQGKILNETKLTLPGNEPVSQTPYNLPYYFYTVPDADKVTVHAKTITLDNNKTEGDYSLEVNAASQIQAGLLSADDKKKIDTLVPKPGYISLWESNLGKPSNFVYDVPYTYKEGDYYRVSIANTSEPKYRPVGSSYDGVASTTLETDTILANDLYIFHKGAWVLQHFGEGTSTGSGFFILEGSEVADTYSFTVDKTIEEFAQAIADGKQPMLKFNWLNSFVSYAPMVQKKGDQNSWQASYILGEETVLFTFVAPETETAFECYFATYALQDVFTGASTTPDPGSDGKKGLVPAPQIADINKFLKGDGTWASLGIDSMSFKGTLGTTGTIQALPTASADTKGWTYKVITAGEYQGQSAEVGDLFICGDPDGAYQWVRVPSGATGASAFFATYGTTTYSAVLAAYNANNIIMVKKGAVDIYQLAQFDSTNNLFIFKKISGGGTDSVKVESVVIKNDDTWTSSTDEFTKVSVSASGTSTSPTVAYITINGVESKIAGEGGTSELFIVEGTFNTGSATEFTVNKTIAQVEAAAAAGQLIIIKLNAFYMVASCDTTGHALLASVGDKTVVRVVRLSQNETTPTEYEGVYSENEYVSIDDATIKRNDDDQLYVYNKTNQQTTLTDGISYVSNEVGDEGACMKYISTDNTVKAGIGVNAGGGATGLYGQIYAVDGTQSNLGTRLSITKDKMYYTKNQTTPTFTADNEIATIGDITSGGGSTYLIETVYDEETSPLTFTLASGYTTALIKEAIDANKLPVLKLGSALFPLNSYSATTTTPAEISIHGSFGTQHSIAHILIENSGAGTITADEFTKTQILTSSDTTTKAKYIQVGNTAYYLEDVVTIVGTRISPTDERFTIDTTCEVLEAHFALNKAILLHIDGKYISLTSCDTTAHTVIGYYSDASNITEYNLECDSGSGDYTGIITAYSYGVDNVFIVHGTRGTGNTFTTDEYISDIASAFEADKVVLLNFTTVGEYDQFIRLSYYDSWAGTIYGITATDEYIQKYVLYGNERQGYYTSSLYTERFVITGEQTPAQILTNEYSIDKTDTEIAAAYTAGKIILLYLNNQYIRMSLYRSTGTTYRLFGYVPGDEESYKYSINTVGQIGKYESYAYGTQVEVLESSTATDELKYINIDNHEYKIPVDVFLITIDSTGSVEQSVTAVNNAFNAGKAIFFKTSDKLIPMMNIDTTGSTLIGYEHVDENNYVEHNFESIVTDRYEYSHISRKYATTKLDLPGNEPVSGTPYNLPYYFYTTPAADKVTVHAKTITLDNNKTEGDYTLDVTSATQTQAGLMSAADKTKLDTLIIDNVTSTDTDKALSANQGKLLNDRITNLASLGRYLSLWDASTGKPQDDPSTLPYTYKSGDWYRVVKVATPYQHAMSLVGDTYSVTFTLVNTVNTQYTTFSDIYNALKSAGYVDNTTTLAATGTSGTTTITAISADSSTIRLLLGDGTSFPVPITTATTVTDTLTTSSTSMNYKPSGTEYSGAASTVIETSKVKVGDLYIYDNTAWTLMSLGGDGTITDIKLPDGTSLVTNGVATIPYNAFILNVTDMGETTFEVDKTPAQVIAAIAAARPIYVFVNTGTAAGSMMIPMNQVQGDGKAMGTIIYSSVEIDATLTPNAAGDAYTGTTSRIKLRDTFTGANETAGADGEKGLVPAPKISTLDYNKFLKGDGKWADVVTVIKCTFGESEATFTTDKSPTDVETALSNNQTVVLNMVVSDGTDEVLLGTALVSYWAAELDEETGVTTHIIHGYLQQTNSIGKLVLTSTAEGTNYTGTYSKKTLTEVSVIDSSTTTNTANYLKINNTEYKLGGGSPDEKTIIKNSEGKLETAIGGYVETLEDFTLFSGDLERHTVGSGEDEYTILRIDSIYAPMKTSGNTDIILNGTITYTIDGTEYTETLVNKSLSFAIEDNSVAATYRTDYDTMYFYNTSMADRQDGESYTGYFSIIFDRADGSTASANLTGKVATTEVQVVVHSRVGTSVTPGEYQVSAFDITNRTPLTGTTLTLIGSGYLWNDSKSASFLNNTLTFTYQSDSRSYIYDNASDGWTIMIMPEEFSQMPEIANKVLLGYTDANTSGAAIELATVKTGSTIHKIDSQFIDGLGSVKYLQGITPTGEDKELWAQPIIDPSEATVYYTESGATTSEEATDVYLYEKAKAHAYCDVAGLEQPLYDKVFIRSISSDAVISAPTTEKPSGIITITAGGQPKTYSLDSLNYAIIQEWIYQGYIEYVPDTEWGSWDSDAIFGAVLINSDFYCYHWRDVDGNANWRYFLKKIESVTESGITDIDGTEYAWDDVSSNIQTWVDEEALWNEAFTDSADPDSTTTIYTCDFMRGDVDSETIFEYKTRWSTEGGVTGYKLFVYGDSTWSSAGTAVSVSETGSSTNEVQYITINGVEYKLAGGGSETIETYVKTATISDDKKSLTLTSVIDGTEGSEEVFTPIEALEETTEATTKLQYVKVGQSYYQVFEDEMVGAQAPTEEVPAGVAGESGLVPKPEASEAKYFLRGDGEWVEINAPTSYLAGASVSNRTLSLTDQDGETVASYSAIGAIVSGSTQGTISVDNSDVAVNGLADAAYRGVATAATSGSTDLITSGAVYTTLQSITGGMTFKGTLGTGGTITELQTASLAVLGHTYKVITEGDYVIDASTVPPTTIHAYVGDLFICAQTGTSTQVTYTWTNVPAGESGTDTWRQINVNGTEFKPSGISTGLVNFAAGDGMKLTTDSSTNTITIASKTTYALSGQVLTITTA